MWGVGILCVVFLFVISFIHWAIKWKNPRYKNGVLPPGSMGLPFIGETLELLIPGRSLDVHPFLKKRFQKYGPIFRTHLAGRPVIMTADAEVNSYLYMQEGKSVEMYYLETFAKLFDSEGECNYTAVPLAHKYERRIVMNYFGVDSLKTKLIPEMENIIDITLRNWSGHPSVNVKELVTTLIFNFSAKRLFGYDHENPSERLNEDFSKLFKGLISLPLNIPGTAFHDCVKMKERIIDVIKKKLEQKRNSPNVCDGDLLDQVVKDMQTHWFLTEHFVMHFMYGILFVSFETISNTITLAFKFLHENPWVVDELTAEHEAILNVRANPNSPLTWDEYKSMTFTLQVINEILRFAYVLPGLLRRTLKDIEIKGYIIPAGWTILLANSALKLNPSTFKDPMTFNPHRWEELDPSVVSKNFTPFGGGTRQCAGAEYAKAFLASFFHVLCTKYRWTKIKGGENISRTPMLDFGNAIHINVSKKV